MSSKHRIGYFLWLESPAEDLIKGQVLDVLEEVSIRQETEIVLIVFARLADYLFNYRTWRNVRRDVTRRGLRLLVLPLVVAPGRLQMQLFFAKWYLIPFIILFAFPAIVAAVLLLRIEILHLRSYPLVPSALVLKTILRSKRVIFDTRSPFPEEAVGWSFWRPHSFSFRLWKRIEAYAISRFDYSVFVTRAHRSSLIGAVAPDKLVVIPNNAARSSRDKHSREADFSGRLLTYRQNFCFAYVGSILRGGINSPELYAEVLIRLRKLNFRHTFLFITREADLLRRVFDHYGIAANEYAIVTSEPAFVAELLSSAHVGLTFLKNPDVRMSVKTAEYLAAGLPLLCNDYALGAKEIIDDCNVGVVSTMQNLETRATYLFENYAMFLKRAQYMQKHFSTERIAGEYRHLYRRLMRSTYEVS